jgi:flagella basal body P-ring formation protein FlgA
MIHFTIRRLALALMLCGSLATSAVAATARPTLRANVTVTDAVVRIGDLVENAGVVADVPIFRAPDLGTRGAVATERVLDAIRPHQLIGIDTRGLAAVIVTRDARTITVADISARIAKALENRNGLGDAQSIEVDFDRGAQALNVEPSAAGELQVVALVYNPRTARFDVTLDLPASMALRTQTTRFTGTAYETVAAVTVDNTIERGAVLQPSELVAMRRPKSEGPFVAGIAAAAGLAARHELRPGQPLRMVDLVKPAIVQRNDSVTIVYEAPGLALTLRGRAQDTGALGDTVSVLNEQSKRVVQGVVSAPDRVTVTAVITHFVENDRPRAPAPAQLSSAATPAEHSVE